MATQKVILKITDLMVFAVSIPEGVEIEIRDYDMPEGLDLGGSGVEPGFDEYGNLYHSYTLTTGA